MMSLRAVQNNYLKSTRIQNLIVNQLEISELKLS